MNEPRFIGIGSQRCGSTSIYNYLCQHPEIEPNKLRKEIHFFDHMYISSTYRWYCKQFPNFSGEFSPTYIFHPHAPGRIAREVQSDPLLIVSMRDPVDRAYSQFQITQRVRHKRTGQPEEFQEFYRWELAHIEALWNKLKEDERAESAGLYWKSCILRGMYARWLEMWFQYFPMEQFEIFKAEDLYDDPQGVISGIIESLGLEPHELENTRPKGSNTYPPMLDRDREYLEDIFEEPNQRLVDLLGPEFTWEEEDDE